MSISSFNSEEYEIMINKKFDNKLDCFNHYLKNSKDKFNDIENLRVFSKNISEFLIKLTDKKIYSNEDIYRNLDNCLYNRKACVFSCGYNLNEHKERFNEFKNHPEFTICCWKSSVNFFESILDVDIIGLGDNINNTSNYLEKINNNFKVLFKDYEYITKNILKVKDFGKNLELKKNDKFYIENNELYINNYSDVGIYKFIIFLSFLGFKEFYLFGMYLDEKWINIRDYNYYDDILCTIGHYYDREKKEEHKHYNVNELVLLRIKEPGSFYDQVNSYYLKDWADFNKVAIYNVSKEGCLSNRITRINFDSIFKNIKEIVKSNHKYEDIITQYDKYVDKDYIKEKFKINNIKDYINRIYLIPTLNKDDKRDTWQWPPNNIILQIINLVPYIFSYHTFIKKKDYGYSCVFFCHYLLSFNKAFNLCFYKDFRKISKQDFWDKLLKDKESEIDIKLDKKKYEEYTNTLFTKNKYFKLILYMFYYNN